jgi:hypothetical protein
MMNRAHLAFLTVFAFIIIPPDAEAQINDGAPAQIRSSYPKETNQFNTRKEVTGSTQNLGINLRSARQTKQGVVVRVKRLIKPGADTAKDFARGIPLISPIANLATLGLYNRALKSDGEAVRATWMSLNCRSKTFNVSNDGYSWQSIFNDPYGQAEEIYYHFCVAAEAQDKPAYLSLPYADPDEEKSAQLRSRSWKGETDMPGEPIVPSVVTPSPSNKGGASPIERQGNLQAN